MGESKRRAERMTPYQHAMQDLTRKLIDDGKLIEAGWVGLCAMWLPPEAPEHHVADLHKAFMAGALHVWEGVRTMLDPGEHETPNDMARMGKIQAELDAFGAELARDHYPTRGSA